MVPYIPYLSMLKYYVKIAREHGISDENIKKVVYATKEQIDKLMGMRVTPKFGYGDILKRNHDAMVEQLKKNNDYEESPDMASKKA